MFKKMLVSLLSAVLMISSFSGAYAEDKRETLSLADITYASVSVPSGKLNMRSKPDGKAVIARVPNKTLVAVFEQDGEWSKIGYDVKKGWVQSRYLVAEGDLGFSELKRGDSGKAVANLKKQMQKLGYFQARASEMSAVFTATTENRLMLLQADLGLEQDGIASPELQAYLFYGPVKHFSGKLPPSVFSLASADFVSRDGSGQANSASGFTLRVDAISGISESDKTENGDAIDWFNVTVSVSGGTQPYQTSVAVMAADGSSFTQAEADDIAFRHPITEVDKAYIRVIATDLAGEKLTVVVTMPITHYIAADDE